VSVTERGDNSFHCIATLAERDVLRYTPAGIPMVSAILTHTSEQLEAGISRQVGLNYMQSQQEQSQTGWSGLRWVLCFGLMVLWPEKIETAKHWCFTSQILNLFLKFRSQQNGIR